MPPSPSLAFHVLLSRMSKVLQHLYLTVAHTNQPLFIRTRNRSGSVISTNRSSNAVLGGYLSCRLPSELYRSVATRQAEGSFVISASLPCVSENRADQSFSTAPLSRNLNKRMARHRPVSSEALAIAIVNLSISNQDFNRRIQILQGTLDVLH